MAKQLMLSEQEAKAFLETIQRAIRNGSETEFRVPEIDVPKARCQVHLDPLAWRKINTLVGHFNSEVAWNGVVRRLGAHSFLIEDVLAPYPQEVTGVTVNSDEQSYREWFTALDEEMQSKVRFQGHSHVNMGVTPSGTDISDRKRTVTSLPLGMRDELDLFYIFGIFNKSGAINMVVYDYTANTFYDTKDVDILIYAPDFDEETAKNFIKEADAAVKSKASTYAASTKDGGKGTTGSVLDDKNRWRYGYGGYDYDHYYE